MKPTLAKRLVDGLRQSGMNFVTYLPETRLSQILPLLRDDDFFELVPVASEAEAVSIGTGAALGGKQVAAYMEGTGVFVSSYNLLSVAKRYGAPMLLLIAHLGSLADQRNNVLYALSGSYVVPFLETLQIQYTILENGQDLERRIKDAVRMMNSLQLPVALVFTGEFTE